MSNHSSRPIRPPTSPPPHPGRGAEIDDKSLGKLPSIKHRMDDKAPQYQADKSHRNAFERISAPPRHDMDEAAMLDGKHGSRSGARSRLDALEDPRLKTRPPEPPEPAPISKKSKDKSTEKVS